MMLRMLMSRLSVLGLALAACVFCGICGARAFTEVNSPTDPTTLVEAYPTDCTPNTSGCGAEGWSINLGGPTTNNGSAGIYQTTGLKASFSATSSSTGTVRLVFDTLFASTCLSSGGSYVASNCGTDTITQNGTNYHISAADIFIESGSGATAQPVTNQAFNYAISLGYNSGGKALGLYSGSYGGLSSSNLADTNPNDKTSDQIWGSEPNLRGYIFGGAFAATNGSTTQPSSTSATVYSPVEVTGGGSDGALTVGTPTWAATCDAYTSTTCNTGSTPNDTLTLTISGSDSALAAIFSSFDIFWGTGDCGNAPIWGDVSLNIPVPEPSSLAVLMASTVGFLLIRRRKRMLSRVA